MSAVTDYQTKTDPLYIDVFACPCSLLLRQQEAAATNIPTTNVVAYSGSGIPSSTHVTQLLELFFI